MIDLHVITSLHQEVIARWHRIPVDNMYEGFQRVVCQQCSYNFLLWHEEDIARSRDVTAEKIAAVKRAIDGYNQQRNDWIERVDDWLTADLRSRNITPLANAPMNTETLGSTIDRLSILALRIYHLEEQLERTDVDDEHLQKVGLKVEIAQAQLADLTEAAQQLANDLYAGRKRHKTYRQLKMYNDPTLNPYLYETDKRKVA